MSTEPTIDVWCEGKTLTDGHTGHAGRRAWVARLIRTMDHSEPDWPPLWIAHPYTRTAVTQRRMQAALDVDLPPTGEPIPVAPAQQTEMLRILDSDAAPGVMEFVDEGTVSTSVPGFRPEFRHGRWRGPHAKLILRCAVCGLDVQRTQSTLGPLLDKLEEAGVSEVSLPAIAGRVST